MVKVNGTMKVAMDHTWIYNQSWEDPRVDIKHFKIGKGDRICMLTTGGDNVIDYLLEDPEYIDTYDMNEHQNYLVDMKLACVKELDYDECFAILGEQNYELFLSVFPRLKKHLQLRSAQWWDCNQHRMRNWHISGSVKFAAYAAIGCLELLGCGDMLREFQKMKNPTIEEQRLIYAKYRTSVQRAARLGQTGMNGLIGFVGVPMRQYTLYDNKHMLLPELLDFICQQTLLFSDNYFYASYLLGKWTKDCCPRYLKPEFFPLAKERAHRVRIITAMLSEGIQSDEARKNYTRFVLLDHQDWLTEEQIVGSWRALCKVGDPNGALVGWRSFGTIPFGCLSHLKFHVNGTIGRKTVNDYTDRVGMYNGLFCAELPKLSEAPVLLQEPNWGNQSLFTSLKTFARMAAAPVTTMLSRNHEAFLDSFYERQAADYDAYRAGMLHGKRSLMWAIPWVTNPKSVLLFGGGTGDVLEYIRDLVPNMEEVVVLDLCTPLLKQAELRAKKYGWTNVKFIQGDATEYQPERKFDVVISSYVFTMIPDWKKAINKAWDLVADDGFLAATDFTIDPADQSLQSRFLWTKTFSFDHVVLNDSHHQMIRGLGTPCAFRIEQGGFPFIPLLKCPYYYTVQRK